MKVATIGKHNQRLKEIRKSISRSCLTPDGLLPVEGPTLIDEAHRSGLEIVELFLEPHTSYTPPVLCHTFNVSPEVFRSIQATKNSQGVIALIRPKTFTLEHILKTNPEIVIVLSRIQDPGNVGTILRVAEAFGTAACLATVGTVSPYNDKLVRASAGSLFRLPYCWDLELDTLAKRLHTAGLRLIGTATDASKPVYDYSWERPIAIMFGNEASGLSKEEENLCDELLCIPHRETIESLNAAVAASIVLYEVARNRAVGSRDDGFTF